MAGVPRLRRLLPDDWTAFRELRLAALASDPLAFGSTVEREHAYPDERWREWARRGSAEPREATFVAVLPTGELVGMVGVFSEGERLQLWGMWVRPSVRRHGLGRALLGAALDWAAASCPGSVVLLEVNPELLPAVKTYRSAGFDFTGVERPLGHHAPAVVRQMVWAAGSD